MNFFVPNANTSQAERELRPLLLDDGVQVMSSFELNKVASLTYGDLVCDEMFELIEKIVAQPLNFSPLTVQKTLVVTKHVLIYGSEKCVNSAYGIGKFIEGLTTFNTVLAAQKQQGAHAFLQRLQGGGVDRGGPIREAAKAVHELLKDIKNLQRIRNESASNQSLVPIGDDKVAFITDEVRHWILRRKIQQQEQIDIRSNLAKSEGGFGGGYMANDGKTVVGAAHGIEAMIKMAQRDKKKFSDSGLQGPSPEDKILQELAAEAKLQKEEAAREAAAQNGALATGSGKAKQSFDEVDLLDFGTVVHATPPVASSTADLLGGLHGATTSVEDDLLGLATVPHSQQQSGNLLGSDPWSVGSGGGNDLLSLDPSSFSTNHVNDPFLSIGLAQPPTATNASNQVGGNAFSSLSGMMNSLTMDPVTAKAPMTPNEDRFAALDALVATSGILPMQATVMDTKPAEEQLLSDGFSSSAVTPALNGFGVGFMSLNQPLAPPSAPPSMPPPMPPPPPPPVDEDVPFPMGYMPSSTGPLIAPGTGSVAATYGDAGLGPMEDNPWVMGGTSGSGLDPSGIAPASAPPPPPIGF